MFIRIWTRQYMISRLENQWSIDKKAFIRIILVSKDEE